MSIRILRYFLSLIVSAVSLNTVSAQQNFNTTVVDSIFEYQTESMTTYGNVLYISSMDWIVTFDISDMNNPVFLDTLIWPAKNHRYNFARGLIAVPPYLYAMATNHQDSAANGLLVIDVSDPGNLSKRTHFPMNWISDQYDAFRLLQFKNFIYAVDSRKLYSFNVESIDSIGLLYTMPMLIPRSLDFLTRFPLAITDTVMYSAYLTPESPPRSDSLRIFNLSTDGSVSPNRTLAAVEKYISSIYVSDSLLFVGHSMPFTCSIYSTGQGYTLDSLTSISFQGYNDYPTAIKLAGNYLYIFFSHIGCFSVYDVKNPALPVFVAEFSDLNGGAIKDMVIKDEYVILSTFNDLVIVVKVDLPTSSRESLPAPTFLVLAPAYPNPVSGSTSISYSLPAQEHITLEVYNMLGQKVQTLYDGLREPGNHTARLDASALPAGTYRVALRSGEGVRSEMVVVR